MEVTASQAQAVKRRQIAVYSAGDPTLLARRQEPIAIALVEAADPSSDDAVLDVGAGTGNVALAAARRGARVTASDLSPRQVSLGRARSRAAGLELGWAVGDAERLPFADASFSMVLSSFGMVFAPRPRVAAHESLRVTRSDASIAYTMHTRDSFNGETHPVLAKYLPALAPDPVDAYLWTDPETVRTWFPGCSVQLREHVHLGERYASIDAWWQETAADVPLVAYVREALDDTGFARFRNEFVELALRHADVAPDGSMRRRTRYATGLITCP